MTARAPREAGLSGTAGGLAPVAAAVAVAAALGIAAAAVAGGETLPLLLLAAALGLAPALYAAAQVLAWRPSPAFVFAVAVLVLQCATFRIRGIEDKSIDAQILLKLGCIGAMAVLSAAALLRRPPVRDLSGALPALLLLAYLVVTGLIAVQPGIALVETASNVAGFLFLFGVARLLGPRVLIDVLILACFSLCCLSIAAYVLDPSLGRMADWVNGAFVPTSRLSGVFGTANAAGAAGGVGLLLVSLLSGISRRRPLFHALVLPMLVCLVLSNNRMSLAAAGLGLLYVYVMRGERGVKVALALMIAALAALVMASFGDAILAGVSRSGSVDEITSGTGRTRIWAVVLDLWTERPLLGYGAGSAKFILPVHPLLFKAAAHAHNMYLNVLFSGGAVGFVIFAVCLAGATRRLVRKRAHPVVGVLVFFLVYGLTEPTIGGLVSFLPFCLFALLILSHVPAERLRDLSAARPDASPFRPPPGGRDRAHGRVGATGPG